PGRNTGKVVKMALVSTLILLAVLGSIGTVLPGLVQALASWSSPSIVAQNAPCPQTLLNPTNPTSMEPGCSTNDLGLNIPQGVGSDAVPNLSLPKTVLSSVANLSIGGVIQSSPENLTLYNDRVTMRLLGNPVPHDMLVGPNHDILSSWSFWSVEVQIGSGWVRLVPVSSYFRVPGTNGTGTFVVRTMNVISGHYAGVLRIAYQLRSDGPLKWIVDFTPASTGQYRLAYNWNDASRVDGTKGTGKKVVVNYGHTNYTLSWDDVPPSMNANATVKGSMVSLDIGLGSVLGGTSVRLDPQIAASGPSQAIASTPQRKVI